MFRIALILLLTISPSILSASEPAIFGVGFTNVADDGARLVFTTSEPMASEITVTDDEGKILRIVKEPEPLEIHAVELSRLPAGETVDVAISARDSAGRTAVSKGHRLLVKARPASAHAWPGYTLFGTSISPGKNQTAQDEAAMAKAANVQMLRLEASWYDLFPSGREPDRTYWNDFLSRIDALKAVGIEPLVVLNYCVEWAKPHTNQTMTWRHPAFGPPDSLEDWEFYVRFVVESLKDKVTYYEIWNEPDAGYLATGSYVERPGLPPPVGREPFKDNWKYWLGDRFVPMIMTVRRVVDDLDPDAVLLNGGWNRDYTGVRGDLLFQRGAASYFDLYTYHTYAAAPLSFSRWFEAIDGQFRVNIDRIFQKNRVEKPLAVTEWGTYSYDSPNLEKGYVTFEDASAFYVKSAFYFLSLQRVEILIMFSLGIGSDDRKTDPSYYMLVCEDKDGQLIYYPPYETFSWIAKTFGKRQYRTLAVSVDPGDEVTAYGIELKDTGERYVAVWQDAPPIDKAVVRPARNVNLSIAGIAPESVLVQPLDLAGKASGAPLLAEGARWKATLPEITGNTESRPLILRITAKK